ncbi:centrosomal protein of 164 kDa isoform X3 [Pseudophryne corroboree]|uniref:centrosomal protein of 164 kDa isoform X3 n=1 Tax=Pseudophryne corroboree TaxID=495146 RepID=UPI0030821863
MLAVPAGKMGDQLILEEDHDENYIPQENEILEYARMIGIDPDAEPELMWLAREGIVALLPPNWKPCQDVTGDIYYFNFSNGQSTWDHPIDEHYREMVIEERSKLQAQGKGKKREKKKKKEKKKDKKVKELPKPVMSLGSPLGPVQGPLGSLAPLRALGDSAGGGGGIWGSLSSSAGSSGGFDTLLSGTPGLSTPQPQKIATYIKSTTAKQPEERVSLTLPGLEEEDEEGDQESEDESPRGSARLLKNLHMDIGSLGGGFEYEESEPSEGVKELAKSDHSGLASMDFGLGGRSFEKVLDITALSPGRLSPNEAIEKEIDEDIEEEVSEEDDVDLVKGPLETTESQIHPDTKTVNSTVEPTAAKELFKSTELYKQNSQLLYNSGKVSSLETEQPQKLTDISFKPSNDTSEMMVERDMSALKEDQKHKLQELTEDLWKKEEEIPNPQQYQDSNLRALKEKLERETKEEEERMREVQKQRLLRLETELILEREEEEERMKEAQKQRLLRLETELNLEREEEEERMKIQEEEIQKERKRALEHLQLSEEAKLLQDKNDLREKMKKATESILEEERTLLSCERESALEALRNRHKQETSDALVSLEKQHLEELERLRVGAIEKHQKEVSDLQNTQPLLQQTYHDAQIPSNLHLTNKKMAQVLDFEREMSDLLQEKRQEVQREHERKLERMNEEHQQVLEKERRLLEEEEQTQRSQLLEKLQEERERIMQLYEQELEGQRQEHYRRQEERQHSYQEEENKLLDLEQNQEIRRKQLMMKTSQLDRQEETLRKRIEDLDWQEKEIVKKAESVKAQETTVEEQRRLIELIKQTQKDLKEMQDQKSQLEAQLEQLQSSYARLQKTASDLEEKINKKREDLKELKKSGEINNVESELRLEDLTKTSSPRHPVRVPYRTELPIAPLSPSLIPEMDSSIEDLRYYISSQGASIQKAKDFLKLQTRSMCRRQTLLKSAKQQWHHNKDQDPQQSHQVEGMMKNLEEEARTLKDIHNTMEKGQSLLQEKEQRLQELEDSLLEEVSEDTLKDIRNKKVVTFDVSDSDDTSSVTSLDMHRSDDVLGSQKCLPRKVQHLTESLRHITDELNNVLSSLGPLTTDSNSILHSHNQPSSIRGIPLSTYTSMSRINPQIGLHSPSQWAWSPGLHPNLHSAPSSAAQSVDSMMMEKWRKYFPGIPLLSDQPPITENKLGYVSAGEQLKMMQRSSLRAQHTDKYSMQAMIDANKKWLEKYRNDPKVPLPSRVSRSPTGKGLVQLGLDENDQIKVYHY